MNKKSESMKALVIREFGTPDVLKIEDIPVPEPEKNEVLVKVIAAAVNPVDYKIRNGSLKFISGKKFPRTLGGDIAGIVEKSFDGSRFQPGDKIFAMLSFKGGGYAEYALVPEKSMAILPAGLDYESAAAIPLAGLTAFQSLVYKGKIQAGSKVLINGASGGVGHFAVQIAKAYNAFVVATTSARNKDFVKSLGADEVIDYMTADVLSINQKFDMVFDAVATYSVSEFSHILENNGIYVSTLPTPGLLLRQSFNFAAAKKAYAIMTNTDGKDLEILSSLYLQGKLRPFIEKTFTLEEGAEAHRMIETHRVKGKIVLKIAG
jgi:NADPH:quinone reductase-like Zn-dependent oxidoreductase